MDLVFQCLATQRLFGSDSGCDEIVTVTAGNLEPFRLPFGTFGTVIMVLGVASDDLERP